jgi:ParB family chromosome partitioning protein
MTAPAAQWQLDRLSTSAREAAEIASLGAGISLSAWLSRLISETCAAEGLAPPSEPPKILEFTREIRDRVPSTPRPSFVTPPAPAAVPPSLAPSQPPSPPAVEQAPVPPQPAPQPIIFRPAAIPTPVPSPTPVPAPATGIVTPFNLLRPQTPPPAAAPPAPVAAPVAAMPPMPTAANTQAAPQAASQPTSQAVPPGATMLPVAAIVAANLGTRRGDDIPEALLADIATRGVRQPLVVRRSAANPEHYEIICGHRRWRAAQRVGLAQLPAVVVSQDDPTAILSSLAENLQTGTLSVVDEAQAYLRLLTQCAVDASAVTAAVGRDRKHIVQSMRLLGLPPLVRHLIGSGMLSRDHAFLLLDSPNPEALADAILAENLSVEAVRQRIANAGAAEAKP